jgi:putative CocE/NonD family hydrolase
MSGFLLFLALFHPHAMSQPPTPADTAALPLPGEASGPHWDNLRVPMRDGVTLSTNVFLPKEAGPFPVILFRTPYDAGVPKKTDDWTDRGYAVVFQDVRGRFRSGGEDRPWTAEIEDAWDTLNWMVKQPWCNGRVGMYGGSYVGYTQVAAARSGHPALKVITPALIGADLYHTSYWGGVLRHTRQSRWLLRGPADLDQQALEQHLPLATLDQFVRGRKIAYWHETLAHPAYDAFWKSRALSNDLEKIQAPAFLRTGWFDLFVCDAFELYKSFREQAGSKQARQHTRMVVGPWPHDINHTSFCDVDFGTDGKVPDLFEQEKTYLDRFLKDDAPQAPAPAPLRLYIMGANEWRDEYEWPLARTQWTRFFLAGEGKANTAAGDGRLAAAPSGTPDRFDYDPAHPVPTQGGAWCFVHIGLKDQREIEKRRDVLVYTSDPLSEPMEVTGPVSAELYVSSSARDTDFTVKLVDVAPDGRALGVTDGIVRARYRNQVPEGELLEPGKVYRMTIACPPTAYLFKAGHRLRVQISSSNFPVFARNLNTGGAIAEETTPIIAHQTVHHSEEYPSHIVLPVIPKRVDTSPVRRILSGVR